MLNTSRTAIYAAFLTLASTAHAENLTFTIFNDSSADLVEFNVSKSTSATWEANLMRGGYLAPGYEIDVVIADGQTTCVYDLRGIFEDGSEVEDFDIDMCDLGSYTFTD